MRDRHRRIARLLAVTGQLRRLEEWRVGRLEQELAAAARRRGELLAAMESDVFRSARLADLLSRHLADSARHVQETGERRRAAGERLLARHREQTGAARLHARLREQLRRSEERNALIEAIEQALSRRE
ncbi:MAG TPA: hypothetical protein ENK13_05065 [Thermopetrobacter sp.]|nr:hypothetical protein [Thermopetrobacter sp.]